MMERFPKILLLGLCFLATAAVAKTLPMPQPDAERGSIGITVRSLAPMRAIRSSATQIFFVRIEEDIDPLAADAVIPSNFSQGKQVYLLNAKPGRYVAVAADLKAAPLSGMDLKAVFSQELIPLTEVTVTPGEMVFAGEYLIATHLGMEKGDPAQTHYYRLIAPEMERKGYFARSFSGQGAYLADLESMSREPAAERRFWEEARAEVFKSKKAWLEMVERRLAALQQP